MSESKAKKTCFIITPIGKPTDPIRRHINNVTKGVREAIGNEFTVEVAHELHETGLINQQVLEKLYKCDLVIANLTKLNPNVMYELAFRHSVGRPAIMIAEKGTELPFNLHGQRMFEYVNDHIGIVALRNTLCECVAAINFDDPTPRSPIHDLLTNFHFRHFSERVLTLEEAMLRELS